MADGFDHTLLDGAALAPSEAISFFRQKALIPTERFGEVMDHAHARGFAVAGAASKALLQDLKSAVNTALTDGTTLRDFQKDFDRIVAKHGWEHNGTAAWRAKIIYDTNLATAYSAGQYAQMATPEARDIFPAWRYRHHACPHPRPEHVAWDGLVLANDDPWWETHFPPNGWRCHCTVEPVTRSDLRRNNWSISEAPPLDLRPWKNPATGRTEMVPKGIDPSFAYNPGKAWQDHTAVRDVVAPKLTPRTEIKGTPVHHVPPAEREAQQVQDIEALLKPGARGEVTAGTLPDAVQHVLGAETPDVLLSDDTLSKNRKHDDLADDDYLALPGLLHRPRLVLCEGPSKLRFYGIDRGNLFRASIKKTASGAQNYVVSLLKTLPARARRDMARLEIVFGDGNELGTGDE